VVEWIGPRSRRSAGPASNTLNKKQLGIFVRTPVPGAVKTRLCPPLSPQGACRLYEAFLEDLSRRIEKLSSVAVTAFYDGDGERIEARHLPRRAQRIAQHGETLGERLRNAFDRLLTGGGSAVIIGSDSPDLPVQYIRRAFQKLRRHDVVLGPASDGGYYLVGLSTPRPSLFENISWGSGAVYAQTLEAVAREGLRLSTLPLWYDVDGGPGLALLRTSVRARALSRRDRLVAVERALAAIDESS